MSFEDRTAAGRYPAYCVGEEMRMCVEGDVDRSLELIRSIEPDDKRTTALSVDPSEPPTCITLITARLTVSGFSTISTLVTCIWVNTIITCPIVYTKLSHPLTTIHCPYLLPNQVTSENAIRSVLVTVSVRKKAPGIKVQPTSYSGDRPLLQSPGGSHQPVPGGKQSGGALQHVSEMGCK